MNSIPAYNYPTLAEAVEKLNRRAEKLGCAPLVLRIVRKYDLMQERTRNGVKIKSVQARMEVEIEGETPKFEGWNLLAAVEMLENGENLVRNVPGRVVPEVFRTTDTHCDHCKATRYRKEVFVLGHDDGRFVQVGRQCIADFLGHVSAENLLARAEWAMSANDLGREAEDEDFGGSREFRRDIAEFLAVTAVVIRRLGWVSNKMVQERGEGVSTSSIAWRILTDGCPYMRALVAENDLHFEEIDEKLASEALIWAQNQPTTGVADYLYNLGVACRQDCVTYRTSGLVASAIAAYQRHLDNEGTRRRRQNLERRHVGVEGKRDDFCDLVIKRMRYFDSQYGVKTLITFEDATGNLLVWWASKQLDGIEEGDAVDIRGTVKKHGDYKGTPQTELQRVEIRKKEPVLA